jgi:hypothetical protein
VTLINRQPNADFDVLVAANEHGSRSPTVGETNMPAQQVKIATQRDVDQCVALIVLAFSSDPAARWLYPDPSQFLTFFPRFVRAFGGKAFESGSAHLIDRSAAALWFPPDGG